jgi:hypothetical protein
MCPSYRCLERSYRLGRTHGFHVGIVQRQLSYTIENLDLDPIRGKFTGSAQ